MIGSVRNAVRILNCFSQDTLELTLADIAQKLNMNKSTTHHLIKTLREEGVLVKNENNLYELGTKMFEWGSLVGARNKLGTLAIPYLHEIVKRTDEIAHVGILDHNRVLILAKSGNPTSLNIETKIGGQILAHCTAIGKVLLSQECEESLEKIVKSELFSRTKETIVDSGKFMVELKKINEVGLAYDRGEYSDGIYCIASKVTDAVGDCIAAISISGPQNRMQKNRIEYERIITSSTLAISKEFRNLHFKDLKRRRMICTQHE